jgi:hypothetical protein
MDNLTWRKSRRSSESGDNCVEVAAINGVVAIRDSKHPEAGHLAFSRASLLKAVMAADHG